MSQFMHLRKPQEFQAVYQHGRSLANRYLVMYLLPNGTGENRLGISASKKLGNSVVRHRFVRLVREAYRLNRESLNGGFDIVVIARIGAKGKSFREIESAFLHLCRKHNMIRKGQEYCDETVFTGKHPVLSEKSVGSEKDL